MPTSNAPPAARGAIPALQIEAGATAHEVDVAAYFTDPDGDPLTYQARSSKESVATTRTDGSIVSVTPRAKGAATITVTATDPGKLAASQQFPVTVREASLPQQSTPLELQSLEVTGGGATYPAFAADVRHYAVRCSASTTLRVRAQASRASARVTLLRADSNANQAATGGVDASVAVSGDHDVDVDLSDGNDTVRYVVHCLPDSFPDIRVVGGTGQASDGFLLVTPTYGGYHDETTFLAILDNNGVPRFHRLLTDGNFWALDFKPHGSGRYSVARRPELNLQDSVFGNWEIDLLDARLQVTSTVRVAPPLTQTDGHDFGSPRMGITCSCPIEEPPATSASLRAACRCRSPVTRSFSGEPRRERRSSRGTPGTIGTCCGWGPTVASASFRTPMRTPIRCISWRTETS